MADEKRKKDKTAGVPNQAPSPTAPLAGGQELGGAARRTIGRAVDAAAEVAGDIGRRGLLNTVRSAAPVIEPYLATAGFARGLAGAPAASQQPQRPQQPAPAPPQQASANRASAAPAPAPAAAATTAPSVAAPQQRQMPGSPVVGSFNGRDLTRADTERLARQLPTASGPVATGGGGFAFSPSTGAAPSSATTQAPNAVQAVAVEAPAVQVPRTLRGDLRGAERERAEAAERIGDQLRWMAASPAGLNSRGERQLYAQLLDTQRQLTGQRVDQATTLETQGAQIDATAAGQTAQIAAGTLQSNADRALQARNFASQDADRDAALELQRRGVSQVLTGADGTASVLRADGSLAPLTGADGQPFRQLTDPKRSGQVSPDTEYKALSDQLTQLQAFGRPEGAEGTAYDQTLAQIRARMAQLSGTGGGAQDKPPEGFPNARKAPDGNWYVRNDDGSYSMVR